MLTISTRIRYGLLALIAVAEGAGEKPVRLSAVAESLGLSFKYLENIFKLLKKGGIVHGTRGPEGGYVLTKPTDQISLNEVFGVLEGPLVDVACLEADPACLRLDLCPLRDVWKEFHDTVEGFLQARTLKDIILKNRNGRPDASAVVSGLNVNVL